jgi:putative membrane protein
MVNRARIAASRREPGLRVGGATHGDVRRPPASANATGDEARAYARKRPTPMLARLRARQPRGCRAACALSTEESNMNATIRALAALGAAATFAVLAAGTALAADAPAKASHADRSFADTAAQAGMAEVEMAKLAQQHAASTDVKSFADRMVADHTKANEQLTTIATAQGIALPTRLSGKDQRELTKLGKLEGAAFDKEYVKSQVGAHHDAVKLFEKESKGGRNDDLRNFAGTTLPTLQDHLSMVTALSKSMK